LRQFADPVTPHTTVELWCRIAGDDWERYVPTLLHALTTGENDVKRLVLAIACEQAHNVPTPLAQPFFAELERLLADEDRLVRMAAIHAVRELAQRGQDLHMALPTVSESLRRIVCHDELPLVREALFTLLETDDNAVIEIASLLRKRQK
jgi:HEAT repeat protein